MATSRFVGFFPRSLTDDPANTTRVSEPATLHVPSTAPPAPPHVAYVVPTFRRLATTPDPPAAGAEHRAVQVGSGLRVYLNRGWFSSGNGEKLALVLAPPGTEPSELSETVTTWGSNPLRRSAPLPGPLELDQVRSPWKIRDFDLPEEEGKVDLAVYEVSFSPEHGLPFADVELALQPSFMPLVRLAVARYQEHAIAGCELSRIVRADFVPLTPSRSLTVQKTGRHQWDLVVSGFSYRQPGEGAGAERSATSVVRAHIELMSKAIPEESAAWWPAGIATVLEPAETEDFHFRWSGRLRIDDPKLASGAWRRRLVVQELETFQGDDENGVALEDRARLISAHTVPI